MPSAVRVARRVDPGQRRRVAGRGISERAAHDRVAGQRQLVAHPAGTRDREGQAHGLRQVRGDRARLGRNPEATRTPDLVAPARDRVVGRGAQAEQRVEGDRLAERLTRRAVESGLALPSAGAAHLRGTPRAGGHQSARAVVQEARVVEAQERAQEPVGLVARARDRVEAGPVALELARHHVQDTAGVLILEQLDRPLGRQARVAAESSVERKRQRCRLGRREEAVEVGLDDGDPVRAGVDLHRARAVYMRERMGSRLSARRDDRPWGRS